MTIRIENEREQPPVDGARIRALLHRSNDLDQMTADRAVGGVGKAAPSGRGSLPPQSFLPALDRPWSQEPSPAPKSSVVTPPALNPPSRTGSVPSQQPGGGQGLGPSPTTQIPTQGSPALPADRPESPPRTAPAPAHGASMDLNQGRREQLAPLTPLPVKSTTTHAENGKGNKEVFVKSTAEERLAKEFSRDASLNLRCVRYLPHPLPHSPS